MANENVIRLSATCSCCGKEEEVLLKGQEYVNYLAYQIGGRSVGTLQDLFPSVPAWIRSGSIDKFSDGFCICSECAGNANAEA